MSRPPQSFHFHRACYRWFSARCLNVAENIPRHLLFIYLLFVLLEYGGTLDLKWGFCEVRSKHDFHLRRVFLGLLVVSFSAATSNTKYRTILNYFVVCYNGRPAPYDLAVIDCPSPAWCPSYGSDTQNLPSNLDVSSFISDCGDNPEEHHRQLLCSTGKYLDW